MIGGGILITIFVLWLAYEVRNAPIVQDYKKNQQTDEQHD